MDSAFLQSR